MYTPIINVRKQLNTQPDFFPIKIIPKAATKPPTITDTPTAARKSPNAKYLTDKETMTPAAKKIIDTIKRPQCFFHLSDNFSVYSLSFNNIDTVIDQI